MSELGWADSQLQGQFLLLHKVSLTSLFGIHLLHQDAFPNETYSAYNSTAQCLLSFPSKTITPLYLLVQSY